MYSFVVFAVLAFVVFPSDLFSVLVVLEEVLSVVAELDCVVFPLLWTALLKYLLSSSPFNPPCGVSFAVCHASLDPLPLFVDVVLPV